MDLVGAFMLLALFVLLYSIIIEVFTVLFRLTGLTREKARMQVISMLTNSGFTTTESEIIVSARRRRRLAQATMLFGYSFTVIIVSSIVNVFLRLSTAEVADLLPVLLLAALSVVAAFCIFRLRPIRTRLDLLIERIGNRMMFGTSSNPVVLVDMYGQNAMAEVSLERLPPQLRGVPMSESGLRETHDFHVLYIKREGEGTVKIAGDTVLQERDVILVFGNYKNIRKMFERPASLPIASTKERRR